MLVMRQPRGRSVDLDMPDIETSRYVRCEVVVAKHGYAFPDRVAVTALLTFCQNHRHAFDILCYRPRWRDIGNAFEQQITLCEQLGHRATSLRSSTFSRPWCLDCFRPISGSFDRRERRRSR